MGDRGCAGAVGVGLICLGLAGGGFFYLLSQAEITRLVLDIALWPIGIGALLLVYAMRKDDAEGT